MNDMGVWILLFKISSVKRKIDMGGDEEFFQTSRF